jgi:arylsulfatase A-like enzyme
VLGVLLAARLSVLFAPGVGPGWAALADGATGLLALWGVLAHSLTFELLVLALAWGLARAGGPGRWGARALVAALLVLNVLGAVAFPVMHTYVFGYQLAGVTVGGMTETVSTQFGPASALALLLALLLGACFARPGALERARPPLRWTGMGAVLVVACLLAQFRMHDNPLVYPVVANSPAAALLLRQRPTQASGIPRGEPVPADWTPQAALAAPWRRLEGVERRFNVVLVVLESVRGQSFWPAPGAPRMPRLEALAPRSAVFTRTYGHQPRSTKGFEALFFGVYPTISWESLFQRSSRVALDSLPQRWAAQGLRNAYLINWDLEFNDQAGMLAGRGFERHIGERHLARFEPRGSDLSMVPALEEFISERPDAPFGAVLWTRHTHLPYTLPGGTGHPANSLEAYLATVADADRLVGALADMLERRGLSERTVLIFTSDHGQSFNEHPDSGYGHGTRVYDESSRSPLVFVNPVLFRGERDGRVMQLKDVGATAAWLAGDDAPLNAGWSVFLEHPEQAAYLVNLLDEGVTGGLVLGTRKYQYSQSPGAPQPREQLFDLQSDPDERRDLAAAHPAEVARLRSRYFGWYRTWHARWDRLTNTPEAQKDRVTATRLLHGEAP